MSGDGSKRDATVEAAAEFISARSLIAPGDGVVVGLSGGCDSVALLAVLRTLAQRPGRGYRLTAAHLNHCLRPGADADEQFSADLARRWDIPFITGRRDAAAEARRSAEGVEQAARRLRYEFLHEAAVRSGAARVAVGHHADDNVETILHHVLRGTHIRGLAGIPAARRLGGGEVMLVRPLLGLRRGELEAFCRRRRLRWVTDETNRDTTYRRNFIRARLLPMLRRHVNRRVDEALLRLAAAAGDVEELISQQADAAAGLATLESDQGRAVLDVGRLAQEPPVLLAYVFRTTLERLGAGMQGIGSQRLGELCRLVGGEEGQSAVALGGGYVARRRRGEIIIEIPLERADIGIIRLQCPGRTDLGDGRLIVCESAALDEGAFRRHCAGHAPGVEMLDAEHRGGSPWASF